VIRWQHPTEPLLMSIYFGCPNSSLFRTFQITRVSNVLGRDRNAARLVLRGADESIMSSCITHVQ